MTILRKILSASILEEICNVLGDTNNGLTGSQIHKYLIQCKIDDIYPQCTKRVRLFNALAERQNRDKCSNQILTFIKLALSPNHFVGKNDDYEKLRALINYQLAFVGYELKADGQYREIPKASTLADVKIKVDNLKGELEKRNAHQEIFKYCTAELVANNYFHSVLEACKGLFQRIRELSGIHEDGIKLIEQAFSSNPILIINNYQSNSEKNEHNGFCNLLKGLCSMFRNTTAHEPKIEWDMEEIDAIDILGTISYCHRRLDKAQKIR